METEKLVVDLDPSATGWVKAGIAGVLALGSVNSYVTVASGAHRIVAIVTAIRVAELPDRGSHLYDASEAMARQLDAVMVGRIEAGRYEPGVVTYPPLRAPVSLATQTDLARIFQTRDRPALSLGEAVVAPDQDVRLDANLLLTHHAAVLGTTGSGKSCTVMAIIDGLLELGITNSSIIIFDSNGEYRAAFADKARRSKPVDVCVIGPEPGPGSGLLVPHWFMDNEEHMELLRAAEGAQTPLLQRAIADARLAVGGDPGPLRSLRIVSQSLESARSVAYSTTGKPQANLCPILASLESFLGGIVNALEEDDALRPMWQAMATAAARWSGLGLGDFWGPLNSEQLEGLEDIFDILEAEKCDILGTLGLGSATAACNFDAPRYYSMDELHDTYLPNRIRLESATEPRIPAYATTLMMRLSRLLADSRYDFATRVEAFPDALGRFLRLMLGFDPLHDNGRPPWADAYVSQRTGAGSDHAVTIVDLSLIASDVLETITALLARLLLDFAQLVRPRGAFPMLLVLEEAHRYIPASKQRPSRSSVAFERIAREGRKFGVSLLLATQRPTELSPTVLSQIGTLIVHRTVNPTDQDLIRQSSPVAGRDILRQLPGLATQHAIVLGEAAPVPSHVRIRSVLDPPQSGDPDFIAQWSRDRSEIPTDRIDAVAARWERGEFTGGVPASTEE